MDKKVKKLLSRTATTLIEQHPGCFDNPGLARNIVPAHNAHRYVREGGKIVGKANDFALPKAFNPHKRLERHLCDQFEKLTIQEKSLQVQKILELLITRVIEVYGLKKEAI